jgi:hypothetical protein
MTGKRIWNHRVFQPHGYKVYKGESENIPLLFKHNGYYLMGYMSAKYSVLEQTSLRRYFDIYRSPIMFKNRLTFFGRIDQGLNMLFGRNIKLHDWIIKEDFIFGNFLRIVDKNLLGGFTGFAHKKKIGLYYDIELQLNNILEDIDNDPPEPFFAWAHLFPPHDPYPPLQPYKGIFESSLKLKGKNLSQEAIEHHEALRERARYDEYIRYCDEKFKEFIKDLKLRDKMKNTVIILSSDHGMLSSSVHELTTSIPLIINNADRKEGQIINDLVEQVDISATILDLAQIPIPDWIEGRSLVPLMRGEKLAPKPVFSMNFVSNPVWDQITKGTVAIWDGNYKLIHDLGNNSSLLFNLKEDPDELNDLFSNKPEIGKRLLEVIRAEIIKANKKFSGGQQ